MTDDKELKKLEDQINGLEDDNVKKQLKISFENIKHTNGLSPCDGTWDFDQGKCIEKDETDQPPVVEAGEDREVKVGEKVTLYATATDFKNYLVYSGWSQASGLTVPLNPISADGKTIEVELPEEGTYVFQFSSRDVKGQVGSDLITLTAKAGDDEKGVRAKGAKKVQERGPSTKDIKEEKGSNIEETSNPEEKTSLRREFDKEQEKKGVDKDKEIKGQEKKAEKEANKDKPKDDFDILDSLNINKGQEIEAKPNHNKSGFTVNKKKEV